MAACGGIVPGVFRFQSSRVPKFKSSKFKSSGVQEFRSSRVSVHRSRFAFSDLNHELWNLGTVEPWNLETVEPCFLQRSVRATAACSFDVRAEGHRRYFSS